MVIKYLMLCVTTMEIFDPNTNTSNHRKILKPVTVESARKVAFDYPRADQILIRMRSPHVDEPIDAQLPAERVLQCLLNNQGYLHSIGVSSASLSPDDTQRLIGLSHRVREAAREESGLTRII